jgi:quercetin dioxygenase-like cupin family protein
MIPMRFICLALPLLAIPVFGQRAVPVDNDQVRVITLVNKPTTAKGAMHEHRMNRVMIYLDEGVQRLTFQDGRVDEREVKPGMVVWDAKGGMHQSEYPGAKPIRMVEIELKNSPKPFTPPALDPPKVYPKGYTVELDNEQVRVVRVKFDAKAKVPLHEHALNRVTVAVKPQKMLITPEGGTPAETTFTSGEVRWGTPARHMEENLGDGPFEILMIEIK